MNKLLILILLLFCSCATKKPVDKKTKELLEMKVPGMDWKKYNDEKYDIKPKKGRRQMRF